MATVRSGAEIAGSPELPLAHGGLEGGTENGDPEKETERLVLSKKFIFLYKIEHFSVLYPAFML